MAIHGTMGGTQLAAGQTAGPNGSSVAPQDSQWTPILGILKQKFATLWL